jgi:hypothetical protein
LSSLLTEAMASSKSRSRSCSSSTTMSFCESRHQADAHTQVEKVSRRYVSRGGRCRVGAARACMARTSDFLAFCMTLGRCMSHRLDTMRPLSTSGTTLRASLESGAARGSDIDGSWGGGERGVHTN